MVKGHKYLFEMRQGGQVAVVCDVTSEAAKRRMLAHTLKELWLDADILILTRVPHTRTSRIIAFEQ